VNQFVKNFLVFVVDEDPKTASDLARTLLHSGYPARFFTNPLEALDSTRHESPDVLLVDLKMPEMSGVELAVQMLAVFPDCRILLLSADRKTSGTLATAKSLGYHFDQCIKPVSPVRLVDKVHGYYLDKKLKAKRASQP
jgi:CheY-like chemotaxis protein